MRVPVPVARTIRARLMYTISFVSVGRPSYLLGRQVQGSGKILGLRRLPSRDIAFLP